MSTIIKLITNENKPKVIQDNGKDNIFKMGFKKIFKNNKIPIKIKIEAWEIGSVLVFKSIILYASGA
jgi:hypothetical protein